MRALSWAVACLALALGVALCCASPHPFARHLRSSAFERDAELSSGSGGGPKDYPSLPLPANMLYVPLYLQQTNYSCGPASVLALLWYWKWNEFRNTTEQ